MRRTHAAAIVAVFVAAAMGVSAGQQEGRIRSTMRSKSGLTDVPGIKVGHVTRPERPTGCTVILAEAGAVAGVDVRGSAPGTIETDLLNPVNLVQQVHAVFLSGGSAFGLDVGDRGSQVPLRTEDWFRDSRCKSANRPGRDHFRSRRWQPARHLAHGRLRLSRGRRSDGRGCGRGQRRRGRRRHGWQDGRRRHERRHRHGVDQRAGEPERRTCRGGDRRRQCCRRRHRSHQWGDSRGSSRA